MTQQAGVAASSEHHLAASWKLDLQQHPSVYQQIAAKLGPNHPLAKLIQKELDKEVAEPASKRPRTSSEAASFWQASAKISQRALGEVVQHAEKLTADTDLAACSLAGSRFGKQHASSTEPASGRIDGNFASLQSGEGNLPLHLKLELAYHLGSFDP